MRDGIVSVTLGTSGVIFAPTERYLLDPNAGLETFCHALPETWHFMGVMLSAGGSLRWHRDVVAFGNPAIQNPKSKIQNPYDVLLADAAQVPAGAEGLIFLPYLTGERTPHRDSLARGAFVGLTLRHTQAHLTRAVVEGITFGLRDSLELARSLGLSVTEVRAAGGGARSAAWQHILADVFNADIALINSTEGGALGVALLAGVGAGTWKDAREACDATLRVVKRVTPTTDAALRRRYDDLYARYRAVPGLEGRVRRAVATVGMRDVASRPARPGWRNPACEDETTKPCTSSTFTPRQARCDRGLPPGDDRERAQQRAGARRRALRTSPAGR